MRRLLLMVLVTATLLVVARSPGFSQSFRDQDVITRPDWSIGDWWEFRDDSGSWRQTVIAREANHYVLAWSRSGEAVQDGVGRTTYHADLDGWITKTIAPDGKTTDSGDKQEWVKFPLGIGNRWYFSVWSRRAGTTQQFMYDYDCHVAGWDSVDIAGRSVRALKIPTLHRGRAPAASSTAGPRDSSVSGNVTAWYAPEAKRLVQLISDYPGGPTLNVTAFDVRSTGPSIVARPVPQASSDRAQELLAEEAQRRAVEQRAADEQRRQAEEERLAKERREREAALRADTQAPTIAINYPSSDLSVERDQIVVLGLVTDDTAVARVQVTVNGVEVAQAADVKTGARGVPVRATVKLEPGVNIIEVTAADAAGNVAQVVRMVNRAVVARPPPGGNRLAVVIGIGDYEHSAIPKLRYAVRDAEAIYQVLVGPGGFKKENVLLLTDRASRRPTLRNIKSALGTFLARSARRADTVLIFFAGHGAPEIDARGLERDGLAKYLIPSDADPNDLYATGLSMDEIHTVFGRIEAERMVMFVDACYSGAVGGRTFVSQRLRTRDMAIDGDFLERLTRAKGRAIVTASRPAELSVELTELGHGLFTYFLVEGLKGAADLNRDGVVTLQELYEYVEAEVSRKSRAVGGNQHPVMKGEIEGPLPLVFIGPR